MNFQQQTSTDGSSDNHSDKMVFDDNTLAALLFGDYNLHLSLLEKRLNLELTSRGNHLYLKGLEEDVQIAKQVLGVVYQRLSQGEDISPADFEAAIRIVSIEDIGQLSLPEIDDPEPQHFLRISTRRKTLIGRTPMQNKYIKLLQNTEFVFACGPAGTGKTYIGVAYAAAQLEKGEVERIILARPAVEAGERLGFLPGDMKEKVDPYLRPLYDALYDMMGAEKVDRYIQNNIIEIAPLAFMRGRTLANACIILDEAQNTTSMQMKMFLTRLGEGSQMIITGDPSQVDLPRGISSGLSEALKILDNVEGINQVHFTSKDVVRHDLVSRIVEAYERSSSRDARD